MRAIRQIHLAVRTGMASRVSQHWEDTAIRVGSSDQSVEGRKACACAVQVAFSMVDNDNVGRSKKW